MPWITYQKDLKTPAKTDWIVSSQADLKGEIELRSSYQYSFLHRQDSFVPNNLANIFENAEVSTDTIDETLGLSATRVRPQIDADPDLSVLTELNNVFDLRRETRLPAIAANDDLLPMFSSLPGGTKVLTLIIDSGIAFAHNRFRLSDTKTRVLSFIDMNRDDPRNAIKPRVFRKPEIDALLEKHARAALNDRFDVDEHAFYIETGMIDFVARDQNPVARTSSHGTQVMDAACGYDWQDPTERELAARHAIIAVELPHSTVADSHGNRHDTVLTQALHAAMEEAFHLFPAGDVPVILNYSFGNYAGRHDGNHPVEQLIDIRVNNENRKPDQVSDAFLAAGNSLQERTHARFEKSELSNSADGQSLDLMVLPDDKEHTFVEIWTDKPADTDRLGIVAKLTPPHAESSPDGVTAINNVHEWRPPGHNRPIAAIYHQIDPISDTADGISLPRIPMPGQTTPEKFVITIAIAPTASDDPESTLAPSGAWKLQLKWGGDGASPAVSLWVERGDTPSGFTPRGRQAYFDHPDYERFDKDGRLHSDDASNTSPIKREGTISAIATGQNSTVVSAYRESDREPALYSSLGAPYVGSRIGPDLTAPGDFGWAVTGLLFAGNTSGSAFPIRGTSIAAPLAAREAAQKYLNPSIMSVNGAEAVKKQAAIDTAREQPTKPLPKLVHSIYGRLRRTGAGSPGTTRHRHRGDG